MVQISRVLTLHILKGFEEKFIHTKSSKGIEGWAEESFGWLDKGRETRLGLSNC